MTLRKLRSTLRLRFAICEPRRKFDPLQVVGIGILKDAARKHRDLVAPLKAWLKVAMAADWKSLQEIRRTWRDTDAIKGKTVFNIKGNRYRLIASINYEAHAIMIEGVLTHGEYDRQGWKQ